MARLEIDLREDLKKYMFAGVDPSEYGPRILNTPKVSWLKLTSRKHMSSAKQSDADMDFSGARPQTFIFDKNQEIQEKNILLTEKFISGLPGKPQKSYNGNSIFWTGVNLEKITNDFLYKFRFSNRSRVFNEIGAFCNWIQKVVDDKDLDNWTVIVAGKDSISKQESSGSKRWNVCGWDIGKINRSQKKQSDETVIDIGVLRSILDTIADVDEKYIKSYSHSGKSYNQTDVDTIRRNAGLDNIPLLLIYRIDGHSVANSPERKDLNLPYDIIGIQVCIPGEKQNKNYCVRVTIDLPRKEKEESMEVNE